MLITKDCPRCKGDMYLDRDRYGWHKQCLQCGYLRDLPNIVATKQRPVQEIKEQDLIKTA